MSSSELQLTHGDLAPLAGGAAGRHLGPRADSLTDGGARRGAALPSRPEVVSWRGDRPISSTLVPSHYSSVHRMH